MTTDSEQPEQAEPKPATAGEPEASAAAETPVEADAPVETEEPVATETHTESHAAGETAQWTPVPPPHPYAKTPDTATGGSGGKVLAALATAFGLLALLTVVALAASLRELAAWAGLGLGAVGIALGVIGIVKLARPRWLAILGAVSSTLALFTAVIVLVMFWNSAPSPVDGSAEWSPDDSPQEQLLEWPANMMTGGIVFGTATGSDPGAAPVPLTSNPLEPGQAPAERDGSAQAKNHILVFVDYSCPHCANFHTAGHEYLGELIAQGDTTVEVIPLSFLDHASQNAYSSRATGAMACVVDLQPELAWEANNALLHPAALPRDGVGLTNEQIVTWLEQNTAGVTPEVSDCITSERFVSFAKSLNQWVLANPISGVTDADNRVSGTPTIFVNGVRLGGANDPHGELQALVEELAN